MSPSLSISEVLNSFAEGKLEQLVRPVILCGGAGTRLWPVSRQGLPKQLQSFESSQSLLQATALRAMDDGFLPPLIVTADTQRFLIKEQLAEIGVAAESIILEPSSRNTAPATSLAAFIEAARDPDQLMLIMPSDHLLTDGQGFRNAVRSGVNAAADGALVVFGLTPSRPETGYGYIETGIDSRSAPGVWGVNRFVEKPDLHTAAHYCSTGRHFWNAGIFLFRAASFLSELREHAPDIAENCAAAVESAHRDGIFWRPDPAEFNKCRSISIDYALMERTQRAAMVPLSVEWSDVGSWNAVWEVNSKDKNGNVTLPNVVALECEGCLLRTDSDAAIVALGVKDLVVVATRDAILVIPRERSQEVKRAIEELQAAGLDAAGIHGRVHRPWGSYQVTDRGEGFQVKRIIVKPGGILSLQKHEHRSEHWVVVSGIARATVGNEVRSLSPGESTFVPAGTVHRLENVGSAPLHLIEIQSGAYLGEDDIVRLEDVYGRAAGTP